MIQRMHAVISVICIVLLAFGIPAASSADPGALVEQGNTLVKTKNYTAALAAYNQAIALDSNNVNAWNGKADALNRAEKFSDALSASDTALAIDPSSTAVWINRGYILYNLGRYDDELKAYDTAISLDPDNAEAWFNKGYSLAGMKRYDEAIAAFDKVENIRPDYPNLAANRRIAEQLRDAGTPFYTRYFPIIAVILIALVAIGGYFLCRNKYCPFTDDSDKGNRQSRRRKERQS